MPEAVESIQVRQRAEALFGTSTPLAAGASFTSPVRRVAGFAQVTLLGVADQTFSVAVEEACSEDGPFVRTRTILSELSGVAQRICGRALPCGAFMRTVVTNTSGAPMASLEFCGEGVPAT